MSLRRLGGLLALGLLLASAWGLLAYWGSARGLAGMPRLAARADPERLALLERSEASRGAVLRRGTAAIEFALPANSNLVRVLSNGGLADVSGARQRRQADPLHRWRYVLETEALDASGRTIVRREHHLRRDLAEAVLPGGQRSTGSFFLERNTPTPLMADELRLDFAGYPTPARLRIRLLAADDDLADVLVRAYAPQPRTQRQADTHWRRLSDEQRLQLAKGQAFPPEALTSLERDALIASRWEPMTPTGEVEFRDLHVLRDLPPIETVAAGLPAGMLVGPGRVAALQLPEAGGRVRASLQAVVADGETAEVSLRWVGPTVFQRRTLTERWEGGATFEHRARFGGGWIEVTSTRPAAVRFWLEEAGQEREVTPPLSYLKLWAVQAGQPVEYRIEQAGTAPTALRLGLRRLAAGAAGFDAAPVTVSLLDTQGRVLRKSVLRFDAPPSRYDHALPDDGISVLSDPQELFFALPPKVARLRIDADQPLLVAAATRPGQLARRVRTPEDALDPAATATAIPAWFALRPSDDESLLLDGRARLASVQRRPPEDQPELVSGRYAWEDFVPRGGGAARVFLAPREPGVPDRADSVAATFRPLPDTGRSLFVAAPGHELVHARLAWTSPTPLTLSYRVLLGGVVWAEGMAVGRAGEVALPAFAAGEHALRVESNGAPVRWFASHQTRGPAWVRRLAQRFDGPLVFDVQRTRSEEEFVSVRAFQPAASAGRLQVRVRIQPPGGGQGIGPLPGWLFTERVHDVRPSGQVALPVAETQGQNTDAGQPFFIPLPAGAPRGTYRITLLPEAGPRGWIALSRVTPGVVPRRQLSLETSSDEE